MDKKELNLRERARYNFWLSLYTLKVRSSSDNNTCNILSMYYAPGTVLKCIAYILPNLQPSTKRSFLFYLILLSLGSSWFLLWSPYRYWRKYSSNTFLGWNGRVMPGRSWKKTSEIISSLIFPDEPTETQRGEVACPKSHSSVEAEVDLLTPGSLSLSSTIHGLLPPLTITA